MEHEVPREVQILYFTEGGEPCWTLDLDEVEMCERRGYPHTIVTYIRKEDVDV